MQKIFSVISWNVKHFKGSPGRMGRVMSLLSRYDPDIFALYEVKGSVVYQTLVRDFPDYTFQITEGPQTQEILVGVKSNLTAFITQKVTFKAGTTHMRPGLLVSIHNKNNQDYSLLFLHVASGSNPRGMGLRDDMITRAIKFRKTLDKAAGGKGLAKYIFLGDLNTMGLTYPFDRDISPELELRRADNRAKRYYNMRRLSKSKEVTWSGGSDSSYPNSNLDHVYASTNLSFTNFETNDDQAIEVDVRGWVDKEDQQARDKWLEEYSDHSLLYFEVLDDA
jgi:endonuclease/exonuclease/phosphatase family metal-dependent hydrolase